MSANLVNNSDSPSNTTLYFDNECIISQRYINASLECYNGNTHDLRVVFNEAVKEPLIERTSEINGKRCNYHITANEQVTNPVFDTSKGSAILGFLAMLAYFIAFLLIILL